MGWRAYAPERALAALAAALSALAATLAFAAPPAHGADPVIATAGDIACDPSSSKFRSGLGDPDECRQKYTSDLLVDAGLSRVLPLGDLQYDDGSYSDFLKSYDPSWGRVKSITSPVLGNHEPGGGPGYFDYFNGSGVSTGPAGQRGKGYYSYDVGAWHLIALNSNCDRVSCAAGSAQEQWLRADLAANTDKCKLAYWHHPRFSSGHDGNNTVTQPLWQALYDAQADVALAGHSHNYERFAPQDANGGLDRVRGIREFVVGTGGAFFTGVSSPYRPNSEVRQNHTYGVLFLTLRLSGYDWEFVPEAGKSFTDSGSGSCHRASAAYRPGAGILTEGGGTTLSYLAESGETNDVTVESPGASYVITDRGVSSIADADGTGGCAVAGNRAVCPASGVDAIRVDVRDGDDRASVDASTNATILGGAGADRLTSTDGKDSLVGWTGDDVLDGGPNDDALDGGPNDDALEGGPGDDTLRGDTGSDTADYSSATSGVRVSLSSSSSQSTGGAGRDTLSALENLTGGSGDDTLTGSTAVNALSGADGNDSITSRDSVRDPVSCGAGSDLVTADIQDVQVADCERWDNGAPPDTTIFSGPEGTVNSSSATFHFSSTEPGTFECKLDTGSWVVCSSPHSYSGLSKASHTFRVVSIDQFGNRDPSEATRSWTVKFFPAASFTFSPAVPYVNETVTFTSTSTPTGPSDVIIAQSWDLDGDGTFETNSGTGVTASASYPRTGTVTVGLRVTDDDGETGIATVPLTIGERPLISEQPSSPLSSPPAPSALVGNIADTRSPTLELSGPPAQRIRRRGKLTLLARCDEVCTLSGSARVSIQRNSKIFRTKSITRALVPGETATLALKFSKKAVRTIRRLLARGKRVFATINVVSTDRAGNVSSRQLKVRLRR
jgi:Ca2+-binding RTX toxin-like protein